METVKLNQYITKLLGYDKSLSAFFRNSVN
ncbi:uncharacterized protein METZ01_LOCUS187683 [marine metagenome]|uniref:Uncharacterized protein n=1 Tax=marine metagenome TaxID=408172 RepID=A0A382D9L4_9ZZZZ